MVDIIKSLELPTVHFSNVVIHTNSLNSFDSISNRHPTYGKTKQSVHGMK